MMQMVQSGGFKGRTGIGSLTNTLKEGDFIRAEVLSSDKGVVALKMPTGHVINAKVDAGASFSPGDKVMLEVTGKENDIALLSILREDEVLDGTSGRRSQTGGFEDKSLAPFAARLAALNMPVNEETARVMRDLIAQNPRMSLDEAAFLASNKLAGNDALMKAALAMLSGGDKTDVMLLKLIDMLSMSNMSSSSGAPKPSEGGKPVSPAPLMELFTQINAGASGLKGAGEQTGQVAIQSSEPIITQTGTILQSKNPILDSELFVNTKSPEKQSVLQSSNDQTNSTLTEKSQFSGQNQPLNTAQPSILNHRNVSAATPENVQSLNPNTINSETQTNPGNISQTQNAIPGQNTLTSTQESPLSTLHSQLTTLLSELPEFRQTPATALERFTSTLLRVAGDSSEINAGDTDKLKSLLDKMFTRIESNDLNAGDRLRNAREELFTRLSFIEEAIMRASPSARAEMLEQTQRVMEHVRILNNIDQFVYMQLPVVLGDERKSAELYLFKKKGKKRFDPDNVNILLALDLQYMGHWEALLNIRNREVSIKMDVRSAAEKEHFSAHTVLLHNMLSDADFKLVNTDISFADEDEEVTPLTALSTFDKYTSNRVRKIDFVI